MPPNEASAREDRLNPASQMPEGMNCVIWSAIVSVRSTEESELSELPAVPLTLEGSWVLHQMFHFDWNAWKDLSTEQHHRIETEAVELFGRWQEGLKGEHPNQSAVFSQLGHKGDLMLIHFRDSLADLNRVELELAQIGLSAYLRPAHSYISVVELGLYESSAKTYSGLAEKGLQPGTPEWVVGIREVVERQSKAMAQRLYPAIPGAKYVSFYPMDRKRGENVNWYTEPMADRQSMMHEHGLIGRRYADSVRQIITGSIGFDDWEWGVDLFAEDPLVFKKLIYEMRFDKVSAVYAQFGQFFVGVRLPAANVREWLAGRLI
jgi:hydrogen peroxide-dependent heme synthase